MAGTGIVNYYADLDLVDENADETTIKKAYRKLVLKWHPDKHPEGRDDAEEKIRKINNAYECLSNPTKRQTYDAQRRAVTRKKQGFGPPPTAGAPRMRIPKEFMMQPIGHPDRFIRYNSRRLFVHSRRDAGETDFQSFFEDTKWSLWWLPEVNNMCRIRALGSKARGEKMGAAAGLAGGLNLSFFIDPENPTDSIVTLEDARKGEKMDKVNFIAVTSPAYEGAFRFEAAHRKGYYLIFLPPNHLRVAPFNESDDVGVCDFSLVDFSIMFRFIEMEEVLQPAVAAYNSWVPLNTLRQDRNVLLYFQNILQKAVWDEDDFITYFEGHWEVWEYNKDLQSVRLRPPEEKVAQLVHKARSVDDLSASLASAKMDELNKLPLAAAVKALQVLAHAQADTGTDITKAINRITAQKNLLTAFRGILATASSMGEKALPLPGLLDLLDLVASVGGDKPASDLCQMRSSAQQVGADTVFQQVASGKSQLEPTVLSRLLRLPGARDYDAALSSLCAPMVAVVRLEEAQDLVKHAGDSGCMAVADAFATAALSLLDNDRTSPADHRVEVLKCLGGAGALMEDIARRLQALAPAASASTLLAAVLAISERGFASEALTAAANEAAAKPGLAQLPPLRLLELAVAATKSSSLGVLLGAVARVAASSCESWPTGELVRLLLAVAKAKGLLQGAPEKALLLKSAAVALRPQLGSLAAPDVIRLALAVASDGKSDLLEAAAEEAVERRVSSFQPAQLMILTQGLVQGLGKDHKSVKSLVDYWTESLKDQNKNSDYNPLENDEDEVTKRRRELEMRSRLTADQLVQLSKVLASADSNQAIEALGNQLQDRVKELTENGRKAAETQMSGETGLANYSRRDRLKRAVIKAGERSRSRRRDDSRSKSRSRGRDRGALASGRSYGDAKKRSRSHSSSKRRRSSKSRSKSKKRSRSPSKRRSRSHKRRSRSRSRSRDRRRKESKSKSRGRGRR